MAKGKRLIDLLREDHEKRKTKVDVLGVAVYVTPLTMGEQIRINSKHPDDQAMQMAEMLVLKCHDEEGNPVFGADDKSVLKRAVAGDRLGAVIAAINGRSVGDQVKK